MKTFFTLLVSLFFGTLHAQSGPLLDKSTIDSLVNANLGMYSFQSRNPVVIAGGDQPVIAFFEVQYLDSVEETEEFFPELGFRSRPSISLVQLLTFDSTSYSFKKRTVDTLDTHPGGGGCHFLEIVDSAALIHHDKFSSLVLLIYHPVMPTCSSMTYYYFKSYAIEPGSIFKDIVLEKVERSRYNLYDPEQQTKAFQQLKWENTE